MPLNYGSTRINVNVMSPDETKQVIYTVNMYRDKLFFPVVLPRLLMCGICLSGVHSPVSMKGDSVPVQYFCKDCVHLVTRSNKSHPLTGQVLLEDYIVNETGLLY